MVVFICRTRGCENQSPSGMYCKECIDKKIEKQTQHRLAKLRNTVEYGLTRVKEAAESSVWSSSHRNCFKASFGKKAESKEHRDLKYERWVYHRELGRIVFCELTFKNKKGRADLTIVDKNFVFIDELPVSEKMSSLLKKIEKYPFPTNIVTKVNGKWKVETYEKKAK